MILEEWKQFCREAWENDYESLQIDRFAKTGEVDTLSEIVINLPIQNALRKRNIFDYHKCCIQMKTEDLKNLEELASLQKQVKAVTLQDKLGKQDFHEDMKKVFEPVAKSSKDVSEEVTKTITETSVINNLALEDSNNKLREILIDTGKLATYLLSPISNITNPENNSQFKLVKVSSSVESMIC